MAVRGEIFRTKVVEKIETHILCSVTFFSPENRAVYMIILKKNMVEPVRPQMIIWRMRTTCWLPNATDIHSEYVIYFAFPVQQWLHESASMLRYTYIACLVIRPPPLCLSLTDSIIRTGKYSCCPF